MTFNTELWNGQAPGAEGYQIERSLRFNSSDSAYLSRTPASAGNRKTWTFSTWAKLSKLSSRYAFFQTSNSSFSLLGSIEYQSTGKLSVQWVGSSILYTDSVLRDPSAWYHIVVSVDTTQATQANRVRLYLNGVEQTFGSGTYPAQNADTGFNAAQAHNIGAWLPSAGVAYSDFYLADCFFIDGSALDATSFGAYDDNGIWQPKQYTFTSVINTSQVWSNNKTGTFASNLEALAFNGELSTSSSTGRVRPNNGTTAGFTFSNLGAVTSLRIWVHQGGTGGNVFTVNGTDVTATVDAANNSDWVDFGSTFNSLTAITFNAIDGSNWYSIAGVEVNGELLIDTGVREDNSFHLDFSDNSTAAALGTDTSGNGNDWTVNNIQANSLFTAGAFFYSSTLYTSKANLIANATPVASAGTVPVGNYIYFVPNGTEPTGAQIFSVDGVLASNHKYWYYNGSSWVQTAGGYNNGNFDAFYWGADTNAYELSASRSFYVISNYDASVAQNSGTLPVINTQNNPAGVDSLVDTPTNYGTDTGAGGEVRGNYCTWNPLDAFNVNGGSWPLLDGNLVAADNASSIYGTVSGTLAISSGKWYWEISTSVGVSAINAFAAIGIEEASKTGRRYAWSGNLGYYAYFADGRKLILNGTQSSYGSSWTLATLGVALDLDGGTITFYRNNVSQGSIPISNDRAYRPIVSDFSNGAGTVFTANFGQRPFAYPAPSGYKALCTTNLPDPTIADGSDYFDVSLWDGNSGTTTISGLKFSPDWAWLKSRSTATYAILQDTVRGYDKALYLGGVAGDDAEATITDSVTSFNSDGYTLGSRSIINYTGRTYVGWAWDAGSSTVSNTDGSITSQVRANQTAGFSIVSYTGVTGNQSFGHGLNVKPKLIIIKNRSNAANWFVMIDIGTTYYKYGHLNTTDVFYDATAQPVSSTTVTLGNNNAWFGANGDNYVAYCFAPVDGYSSFGSYTGTGSSPNFIHLGFRPKFWIHKRTDSAGSWMMLDGSRSPYNVVGQQLYANLSNAESTYTGGAIDFLSNGVALRTGNSDVNGSGVPYIYIAFAESPFQYARAR